MKKITKILDTKIETFFEKSLPVKGLSRNDVTGVNPSLLDDNSILFSLPSKSDSASFLNVNIQSYTDKHDFMFKHYKDCFNADYKRLTLSLNRALFCLGKKEKSLINTEIMLIKPIRGGFRSFFSGLTGFMPLNELKRPFYFLLMSYRKKDYKKKLYLLNKTESPVFILRFLFSSVEVSFLPLFQKKIFKKRKAKSYLSKLNLVFKTTTVKQILSKS